MEILVDVTKQDVIDFNVYHQQHSRIAQRTRWAVSLPGFLWAGFWLLLCALSETEDFWHSARVLMPLWMGGLLYAATILFAWRWGMARQIDKILAEGKTKRCSDHGVFCSCLKALQNQVSFRLQR